MVLEGRFNSTVLADILAIPASKTLLRRHLNTLFIDLIGAPMHQHKCAAEAQPAYAPLSAATKVKERSYSQRMSSVVFMFYCLLEQFCNVEKIQSESFFMVDKSF